MSIPTLDGITAKTITSSRIRTRVLFSGEEDTIPVVFVHGNLSSATWWEETMLSLPQGYRGIAHDQRGYGDADPEKYIDATRGMGDFSDDLAVLLDALKIEKAHFVGNSLGGSVMWRFMMDYSERILTLTQVNPGSPYGVGGTYGTEGKAIYEDYAGSGQGLVNPILLQLIKEEDRSADNPLSPRNAFPSFWTGKAAREEELLSAMLSTHTDDKSYGADIVASENWPGFAPGKWGPNNALSPKYLEKPERLYSIDPKPPVLWLRGEKDQLVSDNSLMDYAVLGKMGLVPDYPGEEVFPQQPMISQTRTILERYQANGGQYKELVIAGAAHVPYVDKLDEFNQHFHAHIQS